MDSFFTGTTGELRTLVPGLTRNFSLTDVLPVLNRTAETLLPRFLGDSIPIQLSLVPVVTDADNPLDPALLLARQLAMSAVAKIGFADYLPFAEIQIGDDGITVTAAQDRKAAFEYQTTKLEKTLRETGWQDLDKLVQLISNKPDVFSDWVNTPYYTEHQDALFKTAAEFSKYYPIQDRWLAFWALRPFIQAVEDNTGIVAMARITALPESVTADQRQVPTRNLLRALALESVLAATPNLAIELNGANVQVNYAGQYANNAYYTPPGRELLDWVMTNLKTQMDIAWQRFEDTLASLIPIVVTPDSNTTSLLDTPSSLIYI